MEPFINYVTLFSAVFTPSLPSCHKVSHQVAPHIIMSHLSNPPSEEAWFPNNNYYSLHGYYVTNGNIKNKVIDNKVYEHIMNE